MLMFLSLRYHSNTSVKSVRCGRFNSVEAKLIFVYAFKFSTGKLAGVVEFGLEAVKAREWGGIANFKLGKSKAVARKSRLLALLNHTMLQSCVCVGKTFGDPTRRRVTRAAPLSWWLVAAPRPKSEKCLIQKYSIFCQALRPRVLG